MIKILFMKKNIAIGSFLSLLVFVIVSCKKNNLVVDQEVTPPAYAKFNVKAAADTAATYYVSSANTPFKIPIGITTVSDKDRTIQLCYTSTSAVAGVQYTAPASIIIPAGKVLDSLSIQGLFSGYPSASRIDVLYIKICGGDVPASAYWATYELTIRKFCDVVLTSLGGNFIANEYLETGAFNYGPYASGVVNLTSTGPTTASGAFVNLFDFGWNNINFTMDWTDPANFKIDIPLQLTGASNGGGNYSYVQGTAGKINTFSSCDQTYSISLDLMVDPTTVDYSGYQIRLKR